MSKILDAIKTALLEGEAKVSLSEASTLTGSGTGIGGRVAYDPAFAALRMANPLRQFARVVPCYDSERAFVVKTGNANGQANPWGYQFTPNSGNVATSFWQLPMRAITATIPVRSAVMSDIDSLEEAIVEDVALEFAGIEAESMVQNNDQGGSTTTSTGATEGLRGLDSYPSGANAAFGTNGPAMTNGRHTVRTLTYSSSIGYNDIVALASALPAQYWNMDTTCWMMHPNTILALRELKDSAGLPLFLEMGDADAAAVGRIFGHYVVANPYIDEAGAGKFPVYLADWSRFLTICDNEEMTIKRFDQAAPGFVTLFCEKRVLSTIRDVFAGVRLTAA